MIRRHPPATPEGAIRAALADQIEAAPLAYDEPWSACEPYVLALVRGPAPSPATPAEVWCGHPKLHERHWHPRVDAECPGAPPSPASPDDWTLHREQTERTIGPDRHSEPGLDNIYPATSPSPATPPEGEERAHVVELFIDNEGHGWECSCGAVSSDRFSSPLGVESDPWLEGHAAPPPASPAETRRAAWYVWTQGYAAGFKDSDHGDLTRNPYAVDGETVSLPGEQPGGAVRRLVQTWDSRSVSDRADAVVWDQARAELRHALDTDAGDFERYGTGPAPSSASPAETREGVWVAEQMRRPVNVEQYARLDAFYAAVLDRMPGHEGTVYDDDVWMSLALDWIDSLAASPAVSLPGEAEGQPIPEDEWTHCANCGSVRPASRPHRVGECAPPSLPGEQPGGEQT